MPQRWSVDRGARLGLALLVAATGCGGERRLPTAASPAIDNIEAAVPDRVARDEGAGGESSQREHRARPRSAVVAEAKAALGAVLTGEQTYLQRWGTYTNVADTHEARLKLGVDLSEPSRRWTFSVSHATATGLIGVARGRARTRAHGLIVTLHHTRGQPVEWTVRCLRDRRIRRRAP